MREPPYSPDPCSKCGAMSPCTDWNEVDIGVGIQTFEPVYTCPTHGEFGYSFPEGSQSCVPIFRYDDGSP